LVNVKAMVAKLVHTLMDSTIVDHCVILMGLAEDAERPDEQEQYSTFLAGFRPGTQLLDACVMFVVVNVPSRHRVFSYDHLKLVLTHVMCKVSCCTSVDAVMVVSDCIIAQFSEGCCQAWMVFYDDCFGSTVGTKQG